MRFTFGIKQMKPYYIAFAILLAFIALGECASSEPLSPDAKAAFLRGVARLEKQKEEIFNTATMPALNPILDVQITSKIAPGDPKRASTGWVSVRTRSTKDSGHVKKFWFSLKDGKWVLTSSERSPWESGHPPMVSIGEDLSQPIQQKVKTCFELP